MSGSPWKDKDQILKLNKDCENLSFKVITGPIRHAFKFDPSHCSPSINIEEDGYKFKGNTSSWVSVVGDTPVAMEGEVLLTFEVLKLAETIEFGFAP